MSLRLWVVFVAIIYLYDLRLCMVFVAIIYLYDTKAVHGFCGNYLPV